MMTRTELDRLIEQRARLSAQIGPKKQAGEDVTALIQESAKVSQRIKQIERELAAADEPEAGAEGNQLTVDIVTSASEFEALRDDWHQLEEASDSLSVFMSWEWLYTWWEVFGTGKQLHIVTVRDQGDKLVGLLPLMRVRQLAGLRHSEELAFIGTGARAKSDYLGLMAAGHEPHIVDSIVNTLLTNGLRANAVRLSGVAAGHGMLEALLAGAVASGMSCVVATEQMTVGGPLPGTFEQFVRSMPSKRQRRYIRAQGGTLNEEFGSVHYTDVADTEVLLSQLDVLRSLSSARFRWRLLRRSAWENRRFYEFMRQIAHTLSRTGQVRFSVLTLDDAPAAALLGFLYRRRYFGYQLATNRALARYRPGHCLIEHCIRRLIDEGATWFDFGRGLQEYKTRYFEGRTRLLSLRLVSDEPAKLRAAGCALFTRGIRESVKRLVTTLSG